VREIDNASAQSDFPSAQVRFCSHEVILPRTKRLLMVLDPPPNIRVSRFSLAWNQFSPVWRKFHPTENDFDVAKSRLSISANHLTYVSNELYPAEMIPGDMFPPLLIDGKHASNASKRSRTTQLFLRYALRDSGGRLYEL
jgi:hypothetical protein